VLSRFLGTLLTYSTPKSLMSHVLFWKQPFSTKTVIIDWNCKTRRRKECKIHNFHQFLKYEENIPNPR